MTMSKSSGVIFLLLVIISTCLGSHQTGTNSGNVITFQNTEGESVHEGEAWCEICELVMDRVKVMIKEKDQEGVVNTTLYNLCDIIKGEMRRSCYEMIPMVRRQLTQGFDSKQACLMLQLCGGGNGPQMFADFISKANAHAQGKWNAFGDMVHVLEPFIKEQLNRYGNVFEAGPGSIVTCMLCKTAVTLIDDNLQKYQTAVIQYVVGICNSLPSPTNQACSDAMKYYIPVWWEVVFKDIVSPAELCYKLSLCKDPPYFNASPDNDKISQSQTM